MQKDCFEYFVFIFFGVIFYYISLGADDGLYYDEDSCPQSFKLHHLMTLSLHITFFDS
jgi:hypothetical protein